MLDNFDNALQAAITAHEQQDFSNAINNYQTVLNGDPNHAEANHRFGILSIQLGEIENSLIFLQNAINVNPNIHEYWVPFIDALIKLDRLSDAEMVLDQAGSLGHDQEIFSKLSHNLELKKSANQEPDSIDVDDPPPKLVSVVINLHGRSKFEEAIEQTELLIKDYPNSSILMNLQGNAYADLGQTIDAIKFFNKSIELNESYADPHYNLGHIYQSDDKYDEAIACYKNAIGINPKYYAAYNNLGNIYKEIGDLDAAIGSFKKAINLKPKFAEAYYNMGSALQEQSKLEEAIEAYKKALSIAPDFADAHNNMASVFQEQGKLEEAIEAYKKAISIDPDFADGYFNLSFAKLQTEQWQHGIELQKWRWKTKTFQGYERVFEAPEWDGKSSIEGKTLLVWGEQGPGDMIIWSACLDYYTSIGVNVIVECPRKLVKLLTISFPKITVRTAIKDIEPGKEDFDFQISIATLFGHACVSGKITNRQNTYIFPDQKRVQYWKDRLKLITEKPCIGISWKSPVMTVSRQQNYADLSFWKPLLQNDNYTFFNLQSLDFKDDLQKISQDFGVDVINFDDLDHFDDLAEVAAFSKALDKTISIATTVAHISTAVGTQTIIPTWKQSSWNNILYHSRGPKTEVFYRNTWESWENTFTNITKMLS